MRRPVLSLVQKEWDSVNIGRYIDAREVFHEAGVCLLYFSFRPQYDTLEIIKNTTTTLP